MRAVCAAAGGPGTKEGWAILWREGLTLWDLSGPTPVLYDEVTRAVCSGKLSLAARTLVPGCGSAYDVRGLAAAGLRHVVGCDIAEEAVEKARTVLGKDAPGAQVLLADFFAEHKVLAPASFDFVFDYTFFCAIPPAMRAEWGRRTAELLAPGGQLLTLAFPMASDEVSQWGSAGGPGARRLAAHARNSPLHSPHSHSHSCRWLQTPRRPALHMQFPWQPTGRFWSRMA